MKFKITPHVKSIILAKKETLISGIRERRIQHHPCAEPRRGCRLGAPVPGAHLLFGLGAHQALGALSLRPPLHLTSQTLDLSPPHTHTHISQINCWGETVAPIPSGAAEERAGVGEKGGLPCVWVFPSPLAVGNPGEDEQ